MSKSERPSEVKQMAGLRLKAARLALGVERMDVFAAALNVTPTAYGNYEKGVRLPDPYMLIRLLQMTGIGPDWVYGGFRGGVPFELADLLFQNAAKVGAVVGGPIAESPRISDFRARPAATVPTPRRRPGSTLHER